MTRTVGSTADKPWRAAIRRAVNDIREDKASDGTIKKTKALHLLARRLVDKGLTGDVLAIKEIADRLEGKAVQGIEVGVNVQVTRIERLIVDPRVIEHDI